MGIILQFIWDTIAPPDPEVRNIENMSVREFIYEASGTLRERDVDNVVSFFAYKNKIIRTALIDLKSYANKRIARLLGKVLCEMLVSEFIEHPLGRDLDSPLLLAVPITKKKQRERGCNQCDLILGAMDKPPYEIRTDIIFKIRETDDQVGKNRNERFENQKGCFFVKNPDTVIGRNIIIFDDIVTTGATLGEAKRALEEAGAKKVICMAFAH